MAKDGNLGVVITLQIAVSFEYSHSFISQLRTVFKSRHVAQSSQAQFDLPYHLQSLVLVGFQVIGTQEQVTEFDELLPDFFLFIDDVIAVFCWIFGGKRHLREGFGATNREEQEGPKKKDVRLLHSFQTSCVSESKQKTGQT